MNEFLDLFGRPLGPQDRGFLQRAWDAVKGLKNSPQLIGVLPVHFALASSNMAGPNENYLWDEWMLIKDNLLALFLYEIFVKKIGFECFVFSILGIDSKTHCITTEPTEAQSRNPKMQFIAQTLSRAAGGGLATLVCFTTMKQDAFLSIADFGTTGLMYTCFRLYELYKKCASGEYAIIEKQTAQQIRHSLEGREPVDAIHAPTPNVA